MYAKGPEALESALSASSTAMRLVLGPTKLQDLPPVVVNLIY